MSTSFQTGFAPASAAGRIGMAGAGPLSLPKLIGGMARWLMHGSVNILPPMERTSLRQVYGSSPGSSANAATAGSFSHDIVVSHVSSRPVRVLRVAEAGQPRASVGRMVISGRMADVCAELDRLAAYEVALH